MKEFLKHYRIINSRRTIVAVFGIMCLFILGLKGHQVAEWIALITIGVSTANGLQHFKKNKENIEEKEGK